MARAGRKRDVEVESGTTAARSPSELVKGFAVAGGMLLLSLGLCGLGLLAFYGFSVTDDTVQKVFLVPLGLFFLGIGGALVFLIGKGMWQQCYFPINKERFVIRTTALQWVPPEADVLIPLPFDTIRPAKSKAAPPPHGAHDHPT